MSSLRHFNSNPNRFIKQTLSLYFLASIAQIPLPSLILSFIRLLQVLYIFKIMILDFDFDCYNPYTTQLFNNQEQKSRNDYPPSYIFVGNRKVSFDDKVDVFEVERPSETEARDVWFTKQELARFMRRSSKDPRSRTQDAVTFNHARRVLLHHSSYRKMGTKDSNSLDVISRESSYKSKLQARKAAVKLAKRVETRKQSTFFDPFGFGLNHGITEFYLNSFVALFTKFSFCGSEE
jgi:hypothetical protein